MRPNRRLKPTSCRALVATSYAVIMALATRTAVLVTRTQLNRSVRWLFAVVSLVLICVDAPALLAAEAPRKAPDWPAVQRAFAAYMKVPDCRNADTLVSLIPDRELEVAERPDGKTTDLLYSNLAILQVGMLFGDPCATRLAFRLLRVADAAFAEDLEASLGALATSRPRLFLAELAQARVNCVVVAAFYSDYSDEEHNGELRLRVQRLREPVPRSLDAARACCLRALEALK